MSIAEERPLVALCGIDAGYGRARVLFDLSLTIRPGEVVTLLGRNGMGKSTTLKVMMGLVAPTRGEVFINGQRMTGAPPHARAQAGIGYVPEGRRIFPRLTVVENLVATARPGAWTLARVLALFPRLGERKTNLGSQLSGGEQQMLAIGRALMTNPRLLVLDEATEGLAPVIRDEIWATIRALKSETTGEGANTGLALLIVDKNLESLLTLADHHVVLEKGHVVWRGTSAALSADLPRASTFLEI